MNYFGLLKNVWFQNILILFMLSCLLFLAMFTMVTVNFMRYQKGHGCFIIFDNLCDIFIHIFSKTTFLTSFFLNWEYFKEAIYKDYF